MLKIPACFPSNVHASTPSLRAAALEALCIAEPAAKCRTVAGLDVAGGPPFHIDPVESLVPAGPLPGHPVRPLLVPPQSVPRRSMASVAGRAALIHALAHIEFNAINLALDMVWRFGDMPPDFYRDWTRVAREEALHFTLLRNHLQTLGHDYGDFDAHHGLWDMADKTKSDVLARLVLVARTAEARGLDVSPGLRDRLAGAGDKAAAAILDVILHDEIGHVAVGSHWYHHVCEVRGLDPVMVAKELAQQHRAPRQRGPFNLDARRAAGFTEPELAALLQAADSTTAEPQSGAA